MISIRRDWTLVREGDDEEDEEEEEEEEEEEDEGDEDEDEDEDEEDEAGDEEWSRFVVMSVVQWR